MTGRHQDGKKKRMGKKPDLQLPVFVSSCESSLRELENPFHCLRTAPKRGPTPRVAQGTRGDYQGTRGVAQGTRGDYQGTRGVAQGTRDDYQGTRGVAHWTRDDHQGTRGVPQGTRDDHRWTHEGLPLPHGGRYRSSEVPSRTSWVPG
jgi:hypothetical protein